MEGLSISKLKLETAHLSQQGPQDWCYRLEIAADPLGNPCLLSRCRCSRSERGSSGAPTGWLGWRPRAVATGCGA